MATCKQAKTVLNILLFREVFSIARIDIGWSVSTTTRAKGLLAVYRYHQIFTSEMNGEFSQILDILICIVNIVYLHSLTAINFSKFQKSVLACESRQNLLMKSGRKSCHNVHNVSDRKKKLAANFSIKI